MPLRVHLHKKYSCSLKDIYIILISPLGSQHTKQYILMTESYHQPDFFLAIKLKKKNILDIDLANLTVNLCNKKRVSAFVNDFKLNLGIMQHCDFFCSEL